MNGQVIKFLFSGLLCAWFLAGCGFFIASSTIYDSGSPLEGMSAERVGMHGLPWEESLDSRLQDWIGKPIDEFMLKVIKPRISWPLEDGGKVYNWIYIPVSDSKFDNGRIYLGSHSRLVMCEIFIETDSDGIINAWSYQGC